MEVRLKDISHWTGRGGRGVKKVIIAILLKMEVFLCGTEDVAKTDKKKMGATCSYFFEKAPSFRYMPLS